MIFLHEPHYFLQVKFMAPSIEEIPARCRLKMARSTDPPEWLCREERGGYQ